MIRYNEGNRRSFGVAFNENFVNNIKDANERSIAGLILSATERGLLNNVTKNSDGRFFCFEISKSEGESYEIYFGKKPSPSELAAHPNAERAIRSSGLIRRLFDEIRFRSNCFIAPSGNISAPAEEDILELFDLKGKRISLAFDDSKTVDGDSFSSSGVTHELEVEIFASIGNHYKRMVEVVEVISKTIDGKITVEFSYLKSINDGSKDRRTSVSENESNAIREIAEREKKNASKIFDVIMGEDKYDEDDNAVKIRKRAKKKNEILTAIASSPVSQLHKFLREACADSSDLVGDITVIPCSFFVGAAKNKTFTYTVDIDGVKVPLKLTWNKSKEAYNKDVPLYVLTDKNGRFAGLTCDNTALDAEGNEIVLSEFNKEKDKIVLCAGVSKGNKPESVALSLLVSKDDYYRDTYKGVTDYAVEVTKISHKLISLQKYTYFYRTDTTRLDGGIYLLADTDYCGYNGIKHWCGNLAYYNYVSTDNKIEHGLVYKDISTYANSRSCIYCGTNYYADDKRYMVYRAKFPLIDGSFACENCYKENNVIENGSESFKLVQAFNWTDEKEDRRKGYIFARLAGDGYKSIESGGNVFLCGGGCNSHIYRLLGSSRSECPVCLTEVCKVCKNKLKSDSRYKILASDVGKGESTPEHFCKTCESGRETLYGKRIMNGVKVLPESKIGAVYADPVKTEKVFECGRCSDVVFIRSADLYKKCDSCNTAIENICYNKAPLVNGMKLCKRCEDWAKNEGKARMSLLESEYRELFAEMDAYEKAKSDLISNIQSRYGYAKKIIPHLNFGDRCTARKNLKAYKDPFKEIKLLKFSNEGNKLRSHFKFKVSGGSSHTYYALLEEGKIRLEDVI